MRLRLILMLLLSPALCLVALARPFLGLLGLVVMYYFRPDYWKAPTWFRPQMWITAALALGWLIHARTVRFPPLMKVAAFIAGLCFVNAFMAEDDRGVALLAAQVVFKLIVVMFLTVNLVDTPKKMNWFLWANVLGMMYNMKAIFTQGISSGGVSDDRVDVGVGQGGGANYIAMILTCTLPFLYMRILNGKGWERKLSLFLAPVYVVATVLTGSRGGFMSLGVVALYMLFRSNRKILGAAVFGCMLLLFAWVVPTQSLDRFKQGVGVEGERDLSADSRIRLWKAALTMFQEHPLMGVGLDNYQMLSPRYVGVYAGKGEDQYIPGVRGAGFVTHSTWFQTLAEGGLAMSVPFFLMFPMAALILWRVRRMPVLEPTRSLLREHSVVLEGVFVAFIVSSTFGSHFKIDFMWWYFGAIAALGLIAQSEVGTFAARIRMEKQAVLQSAKPVGAS